MSELFIRPASETDLPAMQALARRTINRRYRTFLSDNYIDNFINDGTMDTEIFNNISHCKALLQNDNLVGFTIFFDNIIHLMIIDPELHRQGLGTILLEHAETELFSRGNTVIRLVTYEDNHQAMNFYRKHGWKITKKERGKNSGAIKVFLEKHQNH